MKVLKGLSLILLGAGIGSFITWRLIERKYNQELYSEDLSVPEEQPDEDMGKTAKETKLKPSIMDYYHNKKILQENNYIPEEKIPEEKNEKMIPEKILYDDKNPYSISAESFGEFDDYDLAELYFFADNIVTNDDYDILSKNEVDEMVGADFVDHFGDYEDGVVYIRNDKDKIDYKIAYDNRRYHDALREE